MQAVQCANKFKLSLKSSDRGNLYRNSCDDDRSVMRFLCLLDQFPPDRRWVFSSTLVYFPFDMNSVIAVLSARCLIMPNLFLLRSGPSLECSMLLLANKAAIFDNHASPDGWFEWKWEDDIRSHRKPSRSLTPIDNEIVCVSTAHDRWLSIVGCSENFSSINVYRFSKPLRTGSMKLYSGFCFDLNACADSEN